MYTLHTINHKTGEEQIREFNTSTDAIRQWEKERKKIQKHYGSLSIYQEKRKIIQDDRLILLSDYMDIYLEPCEE